MELKNKVIVITGAGSGLGKSVAIKVAKLGAKVVLVARTKKELQQTEEIIKQKGGTAEYFVCDLRDLEEVKQTVQKIFKKNKTIDILVNNAGI